MSDQSGEINTNNKFKFQINTGRYQKNTACFSIYRAVTEADNAGWVHCFAQLVKCKATAADSVNLLQCSVDNPTVIESAGLISSPRQSSRENRAQLFLENFAPIRILFLKMI